jgi:hypothetical protein
LLAFPAFFGPEAGSGGFRDGLATALLSWGSHNAGAAKRKCRSSEKTLRVWEWLSQSMIAAEGD